MGISQLKDIADILAPMVAALSVLLAVYVYSRQSAQKRAELFISMRAKLKENANFKEICDLLEKESLARSIAQARRRESASAPAIERSEYNLRVAQDQLHKIDFKEKRDFLGLMEDVAIMKNSRGIRPEVCSYMFGYYAVQCHRSNGFWEGINRESPAWSVFNRFGEQMEAYAEKRPDPARIRF